jgi:hypothetical protein
LSEPIFERAFEKAELAKMTRQEQNQYEENLKVTRDNYAVWKTAIDRSFKNGIAEGVAQEKIETAKKLKQMGLYSIRQRYGYFERLEFRI